MKNKIFRKYFLIIAAILIVFVILGFVASVLMTDLLRKQTTNRIPPLFIAKVVDQLDTHDRLHAIKMYEEMKDKDSASNLVMYDANGEVIYKRYDFMVPPLRPEFLTQFKQPFDSFDSMRDENRPPPPWHDPNRPPGGPDGPAGFGGPGSPPDQMRARSFMSFFMWGGGPPRGPRFEHIVVRLSGEPVYYIGVFPAPPQRPEGWQLYLPLLGPLLLIVSLLLGVAAAVGLIYASVRSKIIEADRVLSEIQGGNLKARFVIKRKDEFGEAMQRFNKMADEIENLVEHLKFVESARNKILQELAHDLRTPVASVRNLLETIERQNEKLDSATRLELAQLSLREVDYFEQLVEDLLLLAQVEEPKYRLDYQNINLNDAIDDVVADCLSRPIYRRKNITIEKSIGAEDIILLGSYKLIYRLLRNVFENAFSFTESKIRIELKKLDSHQFSFSVLDDGPGLTEDQILHFGERKLSRASVNSQNGQRLSVGLGSVIIKKIAQLHRAQVQIKNATTPDGCVNGALLTIVFDINQVS